MKAEIVEERDLKLTAESDKERSFLLEWSFRNKDKPDAIKCAALHGVLIMDCRVDD